MDVERTFAMLKPGVLQRRLAGEIIARIEKKGLSIVGMKIMRIRIELAECHYAEHAGKDFYTPLIDYMTSGPVVALALQGLDAVQALRGLAGATNPLEAHAGTVRGDYGSRTQRNLIHASDSASSAARELALFFTEDEIHAWEDWNGLWL